MGSLRLPGDKSISHRYALLAAYASGTTRLRNFSTGADCASSLGCSEDLGAETSLGEDSAIQIVGTGGTLHVPAVPLDCGNSGSTMRMLAGLLAGQHGTFTLIGDASLSRRPMERVRKPLMQMAANITLTDGHAPVIINGGTLTAIDYTTPVPSAQVKTAVLFAGLQANGITTLRESVRTRDHGELALRAFGAELTRTSDSISIAGGQALTGIDATIPGDLSSAAFFLCAASLFPESNLVFDGLGLNPTRATLLDVLTSLGARISVLNLEEKHGELVGTVQLTAPREGLGATTISGRSPPNSSTNFPSSPPLRPNPRRNSHSRCERIARQGIGPHRPRRIQSPRHGSRGGRVRGRT